MRNILLIALSIILFSCKNENKKSVKNIIVTDSVLVQIVIDEDSVIFEDFKAIFLDECKKWPVQFSVSQGDNYLSNFDLTNNVNKISTKGYIFTESNRKYINVSFGWTKFNSDSVARLLVEEHCDEYYKYRNKGKDAEFIMQQVYAKIPYTAIRINSTIFEISATNNVGHIMRSAVEAFKKKYMVDDNDVIPCEKKFIDEEFAREIKPAIRSWLNYYKLDLSQFILEREDTTNLSLRAKDTLSIHHRIFRPEDNIYTPQLHDYSPNRQYYLNLMETSGVYKAKDGRYHYKGGDDNLEIYLIDRNNKTYSFVAFLGSGEFADGIFWAGNNTFIITGIRETNKGEYYLIVFDLKKYTEKRYFLPMDAKGNKAIRFIEMNMKSRGIVLD